jgi:hypothetical protein
MKYTKSLIISVSLVLFLFMGGHALAQGCDPNATGSSKLCNPVGAGDNPATNLKEFVIKALIVFAGFTTLIPIVAVVFAGFLMIISRGNPESITRAKETLTWTVYGFVMAISSYIIIAATIKLLGADNIPDPNSPQATVVNPLKDTNFGIFLKNMLTNFLGFVGVLAILMLIYYGFRYITSAGNEETAEQAKQGLTWSIAGVITVLLAYVIIRATATFFGLK